MIQPIEMKNVRLVLLFMFLSWTPVFAQNLDIDLLEQFNESYSHHQNIWLTYSNSAYWVPAIYAASNLTYGLAANDKTAKRYALEGAMNVAISTGLMEGLKHLVKRPRPTQSYPGRIKTYNYSYDDGNSFPSGHTSLAFSATMAMAYQGRSPYVSVPVFVWPVGIGYSRMRLGRHYPTDVLTGALIGIGSGILGHWLTGQIIHN